jgi:DNA-binding NtrC family response regulator
MTAHDPQGLQAPQPPRPLVLIAEDEVQLRRVLQRALEREGYRVLTAGSAEGAYELLALELADAVLLDVRLPTMSGLALYLAILNRWPGLAGRVAIMTGDAEAEEVRAWLERNPCTVLRKPFNLREIFEWLHAAVQVRDRGRANG